MCDGAKLPCSNQEHAEQHTKIEQNDECRQSPNSDATKQLLTQGHTRLVGHGDEYRDKEYAYERGVGVDCGKHRRLVTVGLGIEQQHLR